MFVRRNMERGYNARDMNVPFLKEQAIKFDIVKVRVHDTTACGCFWLASVVVSLRAVPSGAT